MTLDQMKALLARAHALPHGTAADVFMTAAIMAETIESVAPPPAPKKQRVKDGDKMITAARLRLRGLSYSSVAEAAHDLVDKKGLTVAAAAKQMGASDEQVTGALRNWRTANPTNGARTS